jgi:protein-S-isoprenylcysteine O-methyltransferase Ste14
MKTGSKRYDFGGVPGNLLLIIFLPFIVYYLYFCLRYNHGQLVPAGITVKDIRAFLEDIVPTGRAFLTYGVWIGFQALLQVVVPGNKVSGRMLEGGKRLSYRMNGLVSFIVTLGLFWALILTGVINPLALFSGIGSLISVVIIFAYGFSVFLYLYGRFAVSGKAPTASAIHNFFMGYSLNPRIGSFDLKLFFEARPSLIGWIILSFLYATVQYETTGTVSVSMVLVCLFQFIYVLDYFLHEEAILSTMDIVHDRFGFMLCFGDSVWVPFTYSVQAHYLITRVESLPSWATVLLVLLFTAGYLIFRITNLQKHHFRQDPHRTIWGKKPEYIQTAQGNKLLVSGFWGWSRHFNYVGDILMAAAWSLPCLFASLLPYFYPLYFSVLLIHRERRDFNRCRAKYGKDWERYCQRVRWRILPGIY